MNIIEIKFSHDLPTTAQNKLRTKMEMALWKERHRKAIIEEDYYALGVLDREYEMVGLP